MRPATALLLAAILAATVVPRLPLLANAVHWFNSDEAINALVVKHLLDGRGFSFYNWGTTYFGVQEGLLAIPFVVLVGLEPLAFKLTAVAGFLFLVAATFVLGRTLYGRAAGLAAAALLVTFSPQVVQWSSLANVGYGLVMGWGSLMLAFLDRLRRRPSWRGAAWLGLMAGFGFYMYELFIAYLAVLLAFAATASFPWRALLAPGAAARRRALAAAGGQLRLAAAFAAGFALGWAPKVAVLLTGASGEKRPDYHLADLEKLRANAALLFRDCTPAFLGVNPAAASGMEPIVGHAEPWAAALAALVLLSWAAAWVWGLARVRAALAGAVARPPRSLDAESLVVLLVPATALLFLLSPNPQDVYSNRYLLPWLSSLPVLGGALVVRLARWRTAPAAALMALLVAFPAVQTARWEMGLGYLSPDLALRRRAEPLEAVLAHLRQKGIRGAYGGYWVAFKATFLSREDIVVAPYRDWDRYPPYSRLVDGLAAEAYIFSDPLDGRHAAFLEEVQTLGKPFEARRFGPYLVYSSLRQDRLLPPSPVVPKPLEHPRAEIAAAEVPMTAPPGERFSVQLSVTNRGDGSWSATGLGPGHLKVTASYHWLETTGETVVYDGLRSPLPKDLRPGESVDLLVEVEAPAFPGRYTLVLTLVQEDVLWFDAAGGGEVRTEVEIAEVAERIRAGAAAR